MKAPFDDASIERLDGELRAAIAEHWRRRSKSERQVGGAFEAMAQRLQGRATPLVLERLTLAAADEVRHAALCVQLAEAYAGKSIEAPHVGAVALPHFGVGDAELEDALLVAGVCCVNETIATAWLSACLAASDNPLAIMANRLHLKEEMDHARLGWAHLASHAVTPRTRDALAACLPRLLEANAPGWERDDELLPSEGVAGQGLLSASASRQVGADALRDLVIPGFAHVGVDPAPALAWLAIRENCRRLRTNDNTELIGFASNS